MKIRIEYEYLPDRDPCFWAVSKLLNNGELFHVHTAGNSWEQARQLHMDKLQRFAAHQSVSVPKTEEIEL